MDLARNTVIHALERLADRLAASEAPSTDGSALPENALASVARLVQECEGALVISPLELPFAGAPEGPDEGSAAGRRGLAALQQGAYRRAAAHFSAALQLAPTSIPLLHRRGQAFLYLCDYARAVADFDAALRLDSSSTDVLVSRAAAWHQSGRNDRAVADCSKVLDLDPENAAAYRVRAAAHTALGSLDLALTDWTLALALAPFEARTKDVHRADDEVLFQRGLIHARKKDYGQAIADFDQALKRNPHHVLACLHRGDAHRAQGDMASAIRDYGAVLTRHPTNVHALVHRALAHQRRKDTERALADYTEALRHKPDNGPVYYNRALLYRAKGDLARAEADLNGAIRLQPQHWAALYHRGKISLALGRVGQALVDLSEVLRLHPKLVVAHLSRALAHDRAGRFREGIADAGRALELEPNSSSAHLVRGLLHAHLGDFTAAIGDLSRAIELDARLTLAYHERSLAYILRGEYQRALLDCNSLIALEPASPFGYVQRSIVYHFQGELRQALQDYSQALKIDPTCIMTGLNEGLAEKARSQTTQRIADHIDGLRPRPSPPPVSPSASIEIIIASPEAANAPAPDSTKTVTDLQAIQETVETHSTDSAAPEDALKPEAAPQVNGGSSPAPTRSRRKRAALQDSVRARVESEQVEQPEVTIAQFLLEASSPDTSAEAVAAADGTQATETSSSPDVSRAVACPLCRHSFVPAELLPQGRVRCKGCKAVFLPGRAKATSGHAPSPPPRLKRFTSPHKEPGLLEKLRKPVPLATGAVAALVFFYFGFPMNLFGKSDRVAVHPARGTISFEGRPIANASIFLHPLGVNEPEFPRPRATVAEDGSFIVGTYGKDDGAPAGQYQVTVQWFPKADKSDREGGPLPRNLLPGRYARCESSGLTVHIQKGENQIPLFQLKR